MTKLSDLFNDIPPWIQYIESKVSYNDPISIDGLYYYIYAWVNLDTKWCYVGKHKSTNPYNEENYLGSSGNEHYWNSRSVHEFKCIQLQYCNSDSELFELESNILNENFISKFSESGIYNLTIGGSGSTYHLQQSEVRDYAELKRKEFFMEMNKSFYGETANCCTHMNTEDIQKIAKQNALQSLTLRNQQLYGPTADHMTHLRQPEVQSKIVYNRLFKSINKRLDNCRSLGFDKITPYIYWSESDDWNFYHHLANVIYYIDDLRSDQRWTDEMESIYGYFIQFYKDGKINGKDLRESFNA